MNLSNDPLLPKLRSALEKIKSQNAEKFYAWKISIKHYQSVQTLMLGKEGVGFEKYLNRDVLDHSYQIDVYSRHGNPLVMGNSTFSIDPLNNLESQVQKTFNNSLLVGNKPWDLPSELNGTYELVVTVDPVILESLTFAHTKMYNEISHKLKTITKVHVNSGELFTNLLSNYFETSLGLSGQKEKSDIYFEMAIEKLPLPNTQEVLKYKKALSIEDANLSKFIDDAVEETLSITEAKSPKTSDHCTIMIEGEAISSILNSVVFQLNAQREDDKTPFMISGDSLLKSEKKAGSDKINITLDPTTPVMALTTPFTDEGMKPIKAVIVKDDIVATQIVHNRIGQYLHKAPNYIDGNMLVNPGMSTKEELLKSIPECLEVLSFSSLLINPNTLTWSSEIKLGKLYKNGTFDCMIKGGVVSGDIKENLTDFKFGNSEIRINEVGGYQGAKGYVGPNCMLIKSGVKVVGE
ncbi:MAG: metallopeptidase TldD-related protein [Bacteriovorax sp.]|nr:metallopeptidase TldD-related protein [Bacteriovorax sp.]